MPNPTGCREVEKSPLWMGVVLLLIPALIWSMAWLGRGKLGILGIEPLDERTAMLLVMLLLTAFCFVVGKAVTGLWRGVLIDDRNWISLSRLQTVAWTILILSAILVAAFSNLAVQATVKVKDAAGDPLGRDALQKAYSAVGLPAGVALDIESPRELWLVMGISVTSLIGSPLIRNTKKDKPPTQREVDSVKSALKAQGDTVQTEGQLLVRACPENARWGDLFQGEEVGNGAHLDLGKVQNFYFTLILVFAYSQALFTKLGSAPAVNSFPEFSGGMAALLAISHAAYLANKARPQSQTGDPNTEARVDPRAVTTPSKPT
jgi:hypothetical protein